jgi:hypothetical protein
MGQRESKIESRPTDDEAAASRRVLEYLSPERLRRMDSEETPPSKERLCRAAETEAHDVAWRDHLSRAFGAGCPNCGAFPR